MLHERRQQEQARRCLGEQAHRCNNVFGLKIVCANPTSSNQAREIAIGEIARYLSALGLSHWSRGDRKENAG
ncbi:hypothetical protein QO239_03170 [Cupriavidus taiwanensis]|uniref:hypothetical protein n=1 Tax=Cupriavidus taiwanensis TaxID=164546 RepID=UPI0025401437|nr:hypothetical protein [Cupriavidus taiwanensis]MDK3021605.1 hypothetical protein [Cupriavidus taiwanensis]